MARSKIWTALPSWIIYPLGLIPALYYFAAAFTNKLGADPLAVLENALGEWALIFLVAGLMVTPLMWLTRINLVKYRRAVGLVAFAYVVLHLTVYLVLDKQFFWGEIWSDLIKRPYITIGALAFLLLLPLAITSNNRSIRKLGSQSWRKLHRLVYPAALLGAIHYALLEKTWQTEPLMYVAAVLALIGLRGIRFRIRSKAT